jgi:hypothetical protein
MGIGQFRDSWRSPGSLLWNHITIRGFKSLTQWRSGGYLIWSDFLEGVSKNPKLFHTIKPGISTPLIAN